MKKQMKQKTAKEILNKQFWYATIYLIKDDKKTEAYIKPFVDKTLQDLRGLVEGLYPKTAKTERELGYVKAIKEILEVFK
jgi:hypothetical protein